MSSINHRETNRLKRRTLIELNNVGKRLAFVRSSLDLAKKQIAEGCGIPESSYHGREENVRTPYQEEYILLSTYLDHMWQLKYGPQRHYPRFDGREITKITIMWLQYGNDMDGDNYGSLIKELKEELRRKDYDHAMKELEMKRQLDMFSLVS